MQLKYRPEDVTDMLGSMSSKNVTDLLLEDAERKARQEADSLFHQFKRHYTDRWEFWCNLGYWGAGVLTVALVAGAIVWGILSPSHRSAQYENQKTWVCSHGETAACSQVVQTYRESLTGDSEIDGYKNDLGRIQYYTLLYRQATGRDLPDTGPAPEPEVQ